MEIQGTHQFNAPLPEVWEALLNPTVLAQALPGGDQLERIGDNDYKAAMNVRVGPVQGRFEGQVTLSDIVQHESYRMKVSGTGAPGFVNGEGRISLAENDGGTLLTYAGDVQVGGRIAAVGQRLIDSTAKAMIRQGLKTLDDVLQRGDGAAPSPSQESAAAPASGAVAAQPEPRRAIPSETLSATAPSQAAPSGSEVGRMAFDVVKDVVQDLVSDYVPREQQPQFFAFVAGALSMLLFVVLVRLVQRD